MGKQKVGFKVDRAACYLEKHRRERIADRMGGGASMPKADASTPARSIRLRELKFDAEERTKFLAGFHKRKNERRATAQVTQRHKVQRANAKERREQRERARENYNKAVRVPILSDYTFQFPQPAPRDVAKGDEVSVHSLGQGRQVAVHVESMEDTAVSKRMRAGRIDISDLPDDLARLVSRRVRETRGPSQSRHHMDLLREMNKFHRIRKNSRRKRR